MTGGDGADVFSVMAYTPTSGTRVVITDFRPGEDKLSIDLGYGGGGYLDGRTIFAVLDTNGDRVLDGQDVPLDGNSQVTADADGLAIRLHADTILLEGVSQITAEDWLL
jgi:hypothetical protein